MRKQSQLVSLTVRIIEVLLYCYHWDLRPHNVQIAVGKKTRPQLIRYKINCSIFSITVVVYLHIAFSNYSFVTSNCVVSSLIIFIFTQKERGEVAPVTGKLKERDVNDYVYYFHAVTYIRNTSLLTILRRCQFWPMTLCRQNEFVIAITSSRACTLE